jgi:hypothetical protein
LFSASGTHNHPDADDPKHNYETAVECGERPGTEPSLRPSEDWIKLGGDMRLPVASLWAMAVLALLGSIGTACSHHSGLPPASGDSTTAFRTAGSGCVSALAAGVRAGVGSRRVGVTVGRVVVLQLVEPEAYASSASAASPSAFPWLRGQSSDTAGLRSARFCAKPPVIMSLPFRLYPFRAITTGRYQITARINPTYHVPQMHPSLPPLRPIRVTVIVRDSDRARPSSSWRLYTVTASVLYRPGMRTPHACLTFLESLPPAGCGGVPVAGFHLRHLPHVIHFAGGGWQTPELRMAGAWDGRTLVLTRPPSPAPAPAREPVPPPACQGQQAPGTNLLAKRITRAHARLGLIELLPCGRRVWALVGVADPLTRSFIRHHFGRRVMVSGWLRSAHRVAGEPENRPPPMGAARCGGGRLR